MKSSEFIKEDAGSMGSASVAVVVKPLGEKSEQKQLIKRQKSYTNQRTAGGIVKGVSQARVK